MTHIGKCLTARGIKPITTYKHAFKNTYLYGAFSPIDGESFIYEIEGTTSEIFFKYIQSLSEHRPNEFKIVIIDNAGFHSLKSFEIPENIKLIRIPPYSPELNPSEKMWAFVKQHYKNRAFEDIQGVKNWLHKFIIDKINPRIVKSITHNVNICKPFNAHLLF